MMLALAAAPAAEKAPSLVGATREQVIARYGEPRSQIAAANREVLFFARERVTLRDGVVVDVETLPAEESSATPAPAPAEPPASPPRPERPEENSASTAKSPGAPAAGKTAVERERVEPAPPPEPKFEIKLVRPPEARASRPVPPPKSPVKQPASPVVPQTAPTAGGPEKPTVQPRADTPGTITPPVTSRTSASDDTSPAPAEPASPATAAAAAGSAPAPKEEAPAQATAEAAPASPKRRPVAQREYQPEGDLFGLRDYAIALVILAGGLGYLVWRYRQRQLELAATAVSPTPAVPAVTSDGARFDLELLSKLEWKRFEELVAAYYSKTGVVAVRTKTGPASPVNIKISWKGESRPFACVKCIARPAGLVDARPLHELVAVLTAEDIRRGYVVTTGKFSVSARDFAEERHLTLLPGDIFVEKLNALPESARAEILQQLTAGDYTTPSCPKCEARMARAADNPDVWRCPVHPDQELPAR